MNKYFKYKQPAWILCLPSIHIERLCEGSDKKLALSVSIVSARNNQIVARVYTESPGNFSGIYVATRCSNSLELATVESQTSCLILINFNVIVYLFLKVEITYTI